MSHRLHRFAVASRLFALVAALLLGGIAQAQSEAFKISGSGVGPGGLPLPGQPAGAHWAIGNGTHLGKYYGEGTLTTDSANPVVVDGHLAGFTGTFGSADPFTFTAANGDKLVCYYGRTNHGASQPGTFTLTIVGATDQGQPLVNASFIAEFVPQPAACTGKFAGVTGSWIMYAQTDKPFALGVIDPVFYSWEGKGRLVFANR